LLPLQSVLPFCRGHIKKGKKYAYDCPANDPDYLVLLHRVSCLFMGLMR